MKIQNQNFKSESIAFALASGLVLLDDQDGSKMRRQQRWARRKANKKGSR